MTLHRFVSALISLTLLTASSAQALHKNATCDEAKAMAENAADLLSAEGPDKSFAVFNDKNGPFIDRDLYVFVVDNGGVYAVHPVIPHVKGMSILSFQDATGAQIGKTIMSVKDKGWVSYKYPDPNNPSNVLDKRSYILKLKKYTLGVGCYYDPHP